MDSITHIGVHEAVRLLLPHMMNAGRAACIIQDGIKSGLGEKLGKDLGNAFADALTDADLLVEDMLGAAIAGLFSDASFYGEERHMDRISRYIPDGRPYLVTLDPINGTRYFKNGLYCFETIVTFCTQDSILAAIVYFPMSGEFIFACDGKAYSQPSIHSGEYLYRLPCWHRDRTILLESAFADKRPLLEKLGYKVVCPMIDYKDNGPWDICPAGILDGRICGYAHGRSQLIDNVAIVHVAKAAGATVQIDGLNFETKMADRIIAATDTKTFVDIMQAISS